MNLKLPKNREIISSAQFSRRLLALIIDLIIIDFFIISFFREQIIKISSGLNINQIIKLISLRPELITQLLIINLIIAVLTMTYFVLTDFFVGQSFGKYLLKLEVITDIKHSHITLKQSIIRNLGTFMIFPFIFCDSL